jgi:elongation factor 1-gamma
VAKANNLDLELVETAPASGNASYKTINPLDKIPAFVGANGFVLTECIAIAVYRESHLSHVVLSCSFGAVCAVFS